MKKAMVFEGILAIALVILCFLLYAMVTSGDRTTEQWNLTSSELVSFLAMGNGGLYAFSDHAVSFLDASGNRQWTFSAPPASEIVLDNRSYSQWAPAVQPVLDTWVIHASDKGTLYLYALGKLPAANGSTVFPGLAYNYSQLFIPRNKTIMAISGEGRELWNYTVLEPIGFYGSDDLKASGGRVYFHHSNEETILDNAGNTLFTLDNVSDQVAVDEAGNIYAVRDTVVHAYLMNYTLIYDTGLPMYLPWSVIESFYPNGTLRWTKNIWSDVHRQYLDASVRDKYNSLPVYDHGVLYAPTADGIFALYPNGTVYWSKTAEVSFLEAMPFDTDGNIYLRHTAFEWYTDEWGNTEMRPGKSYVLILSPDGRTIADKAAFNYSSNPVSAGEGVIYTTRQVQGGVAGSGLMTDEISTYNLTSGAFLWSYRIPLEDVRSGIISTNDSHAGPIYNPVYDPPIDVNTSENYSGTVSGSYAVAVPAGDRIYVNFRSVRLEYPPVNGSYNATYDDGIFALDRNGNLLWHKSPDTPVTAMVANNSTIIYGTNGGGLSAYTIGLAGLTLAALSYIFVRFFLLGAVSRARDRLGINENRNKILEYVKAHPGSTLSEASRGLCMNLGTVKYHALILGINRRIVPVKDDRFVRYFTNSGSYSGDERLILSLLRREGVKKALSVLLEKPGLSNAQLSRELSISETAAGKTMKVLLDHHIVVRKPVDGKTNAYFIDKKYREPIASAMKCKSSQW